MEDLLSIGARALVSPSRLGWFPTWVVGRRYYDATPVPGEALACLREPDNPHDADAIAVHATRHGKLAGKLGHLPRTDAAYLAPLLDRGAIRLAGLPTGEDDRSDRSPISLEVSADIGAGTLAGPGGRTEAAIWHAQVFGLWQARDAYAHEALDAYRSTVRNVAHSGKLWPETQLFYRLLKGVVADGKAAADRERHLAMLRELEAAERIAAERQATLRAACACDPVGELLRFGGLRVLPLRALQPAPILPLVEALRRRVAVVAPGSYAADRPSLRLLATAGCPAILAVRDELLDTSDSILRVAKDQLLAADDGEELPLHVVRELRRPLVRPLFLRGCELPEPELPELPVDATGYAVFVGSKLRQVALFGHPGCAAVARSALRRLAWHLPAPDDGLTAAEATARVARIFEGLVFDGVDPSGTPRLASQPGIDGGTLLLRSGRLACLRLRVNEGAFPFRTSILDATATALHSSGQS